MRFKVIGTDNNVDGIDVEISFTVDDWDELKFYMEKIDDLFGL